MSRKIKLVSFTVALTVFGLVSPHRSIPDALAELVKRRLPVQEVGSSNPTRTASPAPCHTSYYPNTEQPSSYTILVITSARLLATSINFVSDWFDSVSIKTFNLPHNQASRRSYRCGHSIWYHVRSGPHHHQSVQLE